jgi:hypothetical protein
MIPHKSFIFISIKYKKLFYLNIVYIENKKIILKKNELERPQKNNLKKK